MVKKYSYFPFIFLFLLLLSEYYFFSEKSPNQDYKYHNFGFNLDKSGGLQHTYFGNTVSSHFEFYVSGEGDDYKIFVGQPFVYSIKVNKQFIGTIFGVGYIKHHSTYMTDRNDPYLNISYYLIKDQFNSIEVDVTVDCFCGVSDVDVELLRNDKIQYSDKFAMK